MPAVLVVEYNEDFATVLCEIVEEEGFACSIASTTDQALKALRVSANPPDFILADVRTPGMSVKELLHFVRAAPALAQIRFGLMTAGGKGEVPGTGFDAVLTKPFSLESLMTMLRSGITTRDGSGTPNPSA